jgi:hypothetical protein
VYPGGQYVVVVDAVAYLSFAEYRPDISEIRL